MGDAIIDNKTAKCVTLSQSFPSLSLSRSLLNVCLWLLNNYKCNSLKQGGLCFMIPAGDFTKTKRKWPNEIVNLVGFQYIKR